MTMIPFNDNWTVVGHGEDNPTSITLPHDAMIGATRSRTGATGTHGGYFPGGRYVYSKSWTVPGDLADRQMSLFFEGVYGRTRIRVDGMEVGASVGGYREFAVPLHELTPGRTLLIEVDVDNTAVPNSRWYTGTGIYRSVRLEAVPAAHLVRDGVTLRTTRLAGSGATVNVIVEATNPDDLALIAEVDIEDANGHHFRGTGPIINGRAELELSIPNAQLWSDSSPNLHAAVIQLKAGDKTVDSRALKIGLRTIEVDAAHGLRINGKQTLLRGACIHHDNGILGAATFRAAEFRRARILKEAGFNAIRSSHNPLSRDFLDACDELGLYVLDELTDTWFESKTAHDQADQFDDLWRDDAASMVAKDRVHPSVIMYSIGNEIAESGSERGIATAHEISNFVRSIDSDRPTTIALNFLLNVMATFGRSLFDTSEHDPAKSERKPSAVTSTVANVLANRIGGMMQTIAKLPRADKVSRDTLTAVDVAGYNYAWGRYRGDAKRHADRVVLGTESMPGDIPQIWRLVERLPNVIGDFCWTGWDYLGEAGIGTWSYGPEPASISKPYPALVAGCGLIDITGEPDTPLLLAQAVWGQLDSPRIAVRPLDHAGDKVRRGTWRSTDALQSWAWKGCEGRTAEIEVYSTDDEVEVLVNGRSLGRRASGTRRDFVTRFKAPYEPGEIVAVGYRNGVETSRSALRSAGTTQLRLTAEKPELRADAQDLAYVHIAIADADGIVEMLDDDIVVVEVAGPAELAGLGSAATSTEESFTDARQTTWRGKALAIVRSTATGGPIQLTVTSQRHGAASIALTSSLDIGEGSLATTPAQSAS